MRSSTEIAQPSTPEGVLVTGDGSTFFVTTEAGNLIHVIDIATGEAKADILVGMAQVICSTKMKANSSLRTVCRTF